MIQRIIDRTMGVEVKTIESTDVADEATSGALSSELAHKFQRHEDEAIQETLDQSLILSQPPLAKGTLLEAAFVDPAYPWPPVDGQGQNAVELQASLALLTQNDDQEDGSVFTTDTAQDRMQYPSRPQPQVPVQKWWKCCQSKEAAVTPEQMRQYQQERQRAKEAHEQHVNDKLQHNKRKEKEAYRARKYHTVPEGILIYRLDTSTGTIQLVSNTHANTDPETLLESCLVKSAAAAPDSRRSIRIVDKEDKVWTLTACEQRSSTAWLEALGLVDARHAKRGVFGRQGTSKWSQERLKQNELTEIEQDYMDLAHYSHKLIRSGALPNTKKGAGGAGGIYYSIDKLQEKEDEEEDAEALEAIAKRRAVMKDSWDFYRMICSLLRDRNKYHEVYRKLQLDPVYPYLNSMTGLNDPGDRPDYENLDKPIGQPEKPSYTNLSNYEIAKDLIAQAETAMPSLVEICKALAGSLGMEEVGVGPIKDINVALRKAERKYGGDILKVTDFCRALLVVKDVPSLLALLELARDSFGPLITRVKMSGLKGDQKPKPGGYRDVIMNVELKGHICEIQIHLYPMWVICGVDGFRHYRHCVEYNTDSFEDPYDALDGLDRKTMAELIVMAEEAVAETPLDNLEWYHEKYILDYFAEAGLFMRHGLDVWAEITFRHLIRLRTESPDIGPDHHETIVLYKYLRDCLKSQKKIGEAEEAQQIVVAFEESRSDEKEQAEQSMWTSLGEVYDMVVDPNRKEREEEEKFRKEVKQSKKHWRRIRQERFPFLDVDVEEKKVEELEL